MTSNSLTTLFVIANNLLYCVVIVVSQCRRNKYGFHLSSCSDNYIELQQWGIHYQAALRFQGQYKDEVYIVDKGTLQELAVETPIGLSRPMKPFLHYGGNVDDLPVNDETNFRDLAKDQPVIYHQVVASSTVLGTILNVTMDKEDNVQLNEIEIGHY